MSGALVQPHHPSDVHHAHAPVPHPHDKGKIWLPPEYNDMHAWQQRQSVPPPPPPQQQQQPPSQPITPASHQSPHATPQQPQWGNHPPPQSHSHPGPNVPSAPPVPQQPLRSRSMKWSQLSDSAYSDIDGIDRRFTPVRLPYVPFDNAPPSTALYRFLFLGNSVATGQPQLVKCQRCGKVVMKAAFPAHYQECVQPSGDTGDHYPVANTPALTSSAHFNNGANNDSTNSIPSSPFIVPTSRANSTADSNGANPNTDTKKRKHDDDSASTKKSKKLKKSTMKYDVDVHCSVIGDNGQPCTNPIDCRVHTQAMKKSVTGRSFSLGTLLSRRRKEKERQSKKDSDDSGESGSDDESNDRGGGQSDSGSSSSSSDSESDSDSGNDSDSSVESKHRSRKNKSKKGKESQSPATALVANAMTYSHFHSNSSGVTPHSGRPSPVTSPTFSPSASSMHKPKKSKSLADTDADGDTPMMDSTRHKSQSLSLTRCNSLVTSNDSAAGTGKPKKKSLKRNRGPLVMFGFTPRSSVLRTVPRSHQFAMARTFHSVQSLFLGSRPVPEGENPHSKVYIELYNQQHGIVPVDDSPRKFSKLPVFTAGRANAGSVNVSASPTNNAGGRFANTNSGAGTGANTATLTLNTNTSLLNSPHAARTSSNKSSAKPSKPDKAKGAKDRESKSDSKEKKKKDKDIDRDAKAKDKAKDKDRGEKKKDKDRDRKSTKSRDRVKEKDRDKEAGKDKSKKDKKNSSDKSSVGGKSKTGLSAPATPTGQGSAPSYSFYPPPSPTNQNPPMPSQPQRQYSQPPIPNMAGGGQYPSVQQQQQQRSQTLGSSGGPPYPTGPPRPASMQPPPPVSPHGYNSHLSPQHSLVLRRTGDYTNSTGSYEGVEDTGMMDDGGHYRQVSNIPPHYQRSQSSTAMSGPGGMPRQPPPGYAPRPMPPHGQQRTYPQPPGPSQSMLYPAGARSQSQGAYTPVPSSLPPSALPAAGQTPPYNPRQYPLNYKQLEPRTMARPNYPPPTGTARSTGNLTPTSVGDGQWSEY